MGTKISVLLVNLNNLEYTKQCLEDLKNFYLIFLQDFKIVNFMVK